MTPQRKKQLDYVLMAAALGISTMSLATRAKVGALIVKQGNIKSMGWNGMPSGFPNDELEYPDPKRFKVPKAKPFKLATEEPVQLVTNPLGLHAESNAILKCAREGSSAEGAYLYVTMSPCPDCAKLIIQAGIKKVFYMTKYRLTEGLDILKRAKIPCQQLSAKKVHDVHPKHDSKDSPVERASRNEASGPHQASKPGARKKSHRASKGHL